VSPVAPVFPAALTAKMLEIRRALHRHPELSHRETATGARVRHELVAAGLSEIEAVAETGLVATIRGRRPGRTLALRADLDALPIQEGAAVPFASEHPGVMHACGHDAHTAMLAGVAIALHQARDAVAGTVRCIFQPAEEQEPLGAREVIRAGALEGVEAILAQHVDPSLPVGKIGVRPGPLMASADSLSITIRGRGSHAALPHLGVDAVAVAAAVIQELQQIPSRRVDPLEPVVITLGRIEGGRAANIVADQVVLEGVIRTLDEALRVRIRRMVEGLVRGVAAAHGAEGVVDVVPGEPVLANDPALTELVRRAGREVLGPGGIHEIPRPEMIAEDFAFYLATVPGAMFRLGVGNVERGLVHPLHHPEFGLDEDAIPIGAAVLFRAALRFLGSPDSQPTAARRRMAPAPTSASAQSRSRLTHPRRRKARPTQS
jgi:amidohydrolase